MRGVGCGPGVVLTRPEPVASPDKRESHEETRDKEAENEEVRHDHLLDDMSIAIPMPGVARRGIKAGRPHVNAV